MWLSRRASLFLLAGCGFAPVYGVNAPARALIGQVATEDPRTRDDFDFVAALEAQLGRPTAPTYRLAYAIATTRKGAGITLKGAKTRYALTGKLNWTLTKTGQRVAGGTVEEFTAWSATGSTVAGLTAEADAHRRLMQLLADEMVRRMAMDLA